MFDLLIKDVDAIDGRGKKGSGIDVGISGKWIKRIGRIEGEPARRIIDGRGLILSPGFIDMHSHSDLTLLVEPPPESKVSQGITTEVIGNCGLSGAPSFEKIISRCKDYGIEVRWGSTSEYIERLMEHGLLNNVVLLVGQGNLRGSVVGYRWVLSSLEQMDRMKGLLSTSLEEGAFGLSSGLFYPPGCFTPLDELIQLAEIVSSRDGIYAFHLRSEGEGILGAIREVMEISERTGVRIQISHLKSPHLLPIIEEAQRDGMRISYDFYPYTASNTDLDSILPSWVWEGGVEEELERLRDRSKRERIRQEISMDKEYWKKIIISRTHLPKNRWMEGKSLYDIARGGDVLDFVFDLLIEERLRVEANFFFGDEAGLEKIVMGSYGTVGTDASAISREGILSFGRPHPRGFGTFPRIISRYVKESKILSLKEAIKKMSLLPAKILGFTNRGELNEGWVADLVIFDPKKIKDLATYNDPLNYPDGVEYTIVNGSIVWEKGSLTGKRPGQVLKRGEG